MITVDEVSDALAYLNDSAEKAAQARAELDYVEVWLKIVLAEEMQRFPGQPISAQERDGRASLRYIKAAEALRQASAKYHEFLFRRQAASAKLDAWRTQESTRRAEGKAFP